MLGGGALLVTDLSSSIVEDRDGSCSGGGALLVTDLSSSIVEDRDGSCSGGGTCTLVQKES